MFLRTYVDYGKYSNIDECQGCQGIIFLNSRFLRTYVRSIQDNIIMDELSDAREQTLRGLVFPGTGTV